MYVKDSGELALEWEAANMSRVLELNDMIDACSTLKEKRDLFQTLSKEEKDGLMPERMRRQRNREAPTGSLVSKRNLERGFEIVKRSPNGSTSAIHDGLAVVIGHGGHGSSTRYLMLLPPWQNKEGEVIRFAEAQSYDLKVINE